MGKEIYKKIILIFSIIGVLFSGYLTISKLFSGTCPLNEGCPYFLGYPACLYGFIMFLAIFITSLFLVFKKESKKPGVIILIVSVLGILFSAYFSIVELFLTRCPGGCHYSLLIPTCIYGLVMYIIVFIASIKNNAHNQ